MVILIILVIIGMAFGHGSATTHRVVDAIVGPRTMQHEYAYVKTLAAQISSLSFSNMGGMDFYTNQSKVFQDVCFSIFQYII